MIISYLDIPYSGYFYKYSKINAHDFKRDIASCSSIEPDTLYRPLQCSQTLSQARELTHVSIEETTERFDIV